jgi:hypothetical protein
VSADRRLRHRFQTVWLRGADCAVKLAILPDRKAQRICEFGFTWGSAEVTLQTKFGFLAESNKPANGPRQRIKLAEVVENRSPDAVIGQCFEQALAVWLKPINGLNEAEDAGLKEVVELNLAMTANLRSSGKQAHQRQMLEDQLLAEGECCNGGH